ncbi:uncharacterized protein SPSK_06072 [Sporothrix schenckii 1099-18]|uniref:Wax synthase domain-containing protein n=2 Tax=Sporothrix schenckii TaxID=29908 RepID=U7PU21_SPOS1|nr:uncharacterized protein SPSK_06072 [Sporothrix schenckii 1099-18]ERS98416.1 hypothetical protein HMPREF1624_05200 [Sporothrix schenckii ATCC 58251]KJR89447.1 hypothetical protein SPSK_06072 [Sporothrix schenckii 1099-18]
MDAVTLADYQRGVLRNAFRSAMARGEARPLMLVACAVPAIIVPATFLAVAGRHRALRPLRYAVAVALLAYNAHQLSPLWNGPSWARTSSLNFASAYGAGLVFGWGTLWALVVLVWTSPWDGERVARRRKILPAGTKEREADVVNTDTLNIQNADNAPDEDIARSLRLGHEYYWQSFPVHASFFARFDWAIDLCLAWRGIGWSWGKTVVPNFAPPMRPHTNELVRLSSLLEGTKHGYRRQRTRAGFYRTRITTILSSYLVLDVCAVLMMHDPYFVVGPPPSRNTPWSQQVDQFPTPVMGAVWTPPPSPALLAMPAYLEFLYRHPHLLALHRNLLGLAGMVAALQFVLSLDQFVRISLGTLISGKNSIATVSTAAQLWNYPSIFGSVSQVLDHGLAGFWGSTWHQTFRWAFMAPTLWLVNRGILPKGKAVCGKTAETKNMANGTNGTTKANGANGHISKRSMPQEKVHLPAITRLTGLVIAFGQSAILHAAASTTTLPTHTLWWGPALFFVLSGVGVVVQGIVLPSAVMKRLPRRARQVANLLFTLGWLHATVWLFLDDTSRCGLWLFEPVPFSPTRYLISLVQGAEPPSIVSLAGNNQAGLSAWRWYSDDLAYWHTGKRWWETGLAI